MTDDSKNTPQQPASQGGQDGGQNGGQPDSNRSGGLRFPGVVGYEPPESARDPLTRLQAILESKELNGDEKTWLLDYATKRFANRQRMAYWCLAGILATLGFLLLTALIDGFTGNAGSGILASVGDVQTLLTWVLGFLAAIVGTYYGVSSFRPSS